MKRLAFMTAFCMALFAVPASAQISLYGGGGAAFPMGDDLDGVDAGIQLLGGATYDISEQLSVYAEGQWGSHGIEDSDDVTVNPMALMGGLLYGFGGDDAALSPYIFGGAGLQTVSIDVDGDSVDDSAFGFQVGAGVGFDLMGVDAFAEGRYQTAAFADDADVLTDSTFSIFSIILGVSFDIGGN
jgi:opacity protein-like surface antigen